MTTNMFGFILFLFLFNKLGLTFTQPLNSNNKKCTSPSNERWAKSTELEEMTDMFPSVLSPSQLLSPMQWALSTMPSMTKHMLGRLELPCDVIETSDSFKVVADLPGYALKDINVTTAGQMLTISAVKESEVVEDTDTWHKRERTVGHVKRVMMLPEYVDDKSVQAESSNGVLSLSFKKKKPAETIQKVEIKQLK